jgi:hypothetical protein
MLPAANLLQEGRLAVPQLGPQVLLDTHWLLSSPLMGLGPVPLMLVGGVDRLPALTGVVLCAVASLCLMAFSIRRSLQLKTLGWAFVFSLAFLLHRGLPTSDLYNQKYSVLVYGVMSVAFLPRAWASGPGPWWRWTAAGALPLLHPTLLAAWLVWVVAALASMLRQSDWQSLRRQPGPWLFCGMAAMCLAWYGRPVPLLGQLLPHASYGGFRQAGALAGTLDAAASPAAALPSQAASLGILVLAIVCLWRAARGEPGSRASAPAAVALLAVLPFDAINGLPHYGYYLVGLGPCLLSVGRPEGRLRRMTLLALGTLVAVNLTISARLDTQAPNWTSTEDSEAFLNGHLRPGDRVVLGPPFVLVAAGRAADVPRIVPQPYFLETFDQQQFRSEIERCCNVYIGAPEWFRRPVWTEPSGASLLPDTAVEAFDFAGREVIVARRAGGGGPGPGERPAGGSASPSGDRQR